LSHDFVAELRYLLRDKVAAKSLLRFCLLWCELMHTMLVQGRYSLKINELKIQLQERFSISYHQPTNVTAMIWHVAHAMAQQLQQLMLQM